MITARSSFPPGGTASAPSEGGRGRRASRINPNRAARRASRLAPGGRGRAAFTLLEILLVIALIGMITGVFVVGALSLSDSRPPSSEEVFWQAVNGCRKQALLTGREVALRFAKGENEAPASLVATWEGGEARYPFGVAKTDDGGGAGGGNSVGGGGGNSAGAGNNGNSAGAGNGNAAFAANAPAVVCDFLTTQKGGSAILVGGVLRETATLASVTFYGDGTCTPFRAQLRAGVSEPLVLDIDPWTCAQVLTREAR
ncbi:MAG: type II secretion system GspH family protein [Opitutaceae bacterium]|nr:type II secretion system GspH family protein [Opitutaceae bacterium]